MRQSHSDEKQKVSSAPAASVQYPFSQYGFPTQYPNSPILCFYEIAPTNSSVSLLTTA